MGKGLSKLFGLGKGKEQRIVMLGLDNGSFFELSTKK